MKHVTTTEIDPKDYRFFERDTTNFNPNKNYQIIKEVIEDGEKLHKIIKDSYRKETEDRIDILSTYARHALGGGDKTLKEFMGREWMAKIYGEKIMEKLRIADSVQKLNLAAGNTKYSNYYLT